MEIELRYKIKDIKKIQEGLVGLGAKLVKESQVIDYWFVPKEISSLAEEEDWLDVRGECGMRIRKENGKASLGLKRLTKDRDHNTFIDADCEIESVEKGFQLMEVLGRKNFLTIDKHRIKYDGGEFEFCVDEIKDFAAGLEIEYKGDSERENILAKIRAVADKLGLKETDRFEKSLTVEAMKALARF